MTPFLYLCKNIYDMEYTIIVEKNKDGWLTGQCEQLPEAITQGENMDDLIENMKDAIELVLEYKADEFRKSLLKTSVVRKKIKIAYEKKRTVKAPKGKKVQA